MALFTPEELADWEAKLAEAKTPRDTDQFPYPNRSYNKSLQQRVSAHHKAFRMEELRRIEARPEDVVNLLLVAFHEKGTESITFEETFEGFLSGRLDPANTPETRRHLHDVLEGLRHLPQSWAKSAATRFFRATGKQGKPPWTTKPGSGILGKEYGWKTRESDWFVSIFYRHPLGDLFFGDDSPDCYGEEAYEIEDEGGDRWAATRMEREDDFFDLLLGVLDKRGLSAEIDKPDIPKPKPHKAKVFKPGDRITARNVRDLPTGSHFRLTLHLTDNTGRRGDGKKVTRHYTMEAVYVGKKKAGIHEVRPVASTPATSKRLVNKWAFADAEYIGPWEGTTMDEVEAKHVEVQGWSSWNVRWAWKGDRLRTTDGHDEGPQIVRY